MNDFDIVNEADVIIGQDRQLHASALSARRIYRTVHLTVLDPRKRAILFALHQRQGDPEREAWGFLSERVVAHDDYPSTVFRAVHQQLGFKSRGGCGEYAHAILAEGAHRVFARFFIVYWEEEEIQIQDDEIVAYRWIPLNRLKRMRDLSATTVYWRDHVDWESLRGWFA